MGCRVDTCLTAALLETKRDQQEIKRELQLANTRTESARNENVQCSPTEMAKTNQHKGREDLRAKTEANIEKQRQDVKSS